MIPIGLMSGLAKAGLRIKSIQEVAFVHGSSVNCNAANIVTQSINAVQPDRSFVMVVNNNYFADSSNWVHFYCDLLDATTARLRSVFCASCNGCWSITLRALVIELEHKPKLMQYAGPIQSFPQTVAETDPTRTLIIPAGGHHATPKLASSTSLSVVSGDTNNGIGGLTYFSAAFYLILP